jgi:hypothetical protein
MPINVLPEGLIKNFDKETKQIKTVIASQLLSENC